MGSTACRAVIATLVTVAAAVPVGLLAETTRPTGGPSVALMGNGYIDDEGGPPGRS